VNVAVGTLSSAPYRFGGYLMFGEKHQNARPNQGYTLDTHTATIGPIAREIGFELLWPVLTIESGGSAGPDNIITAGAGEWSLMGTGYWNGITWPGDSPAHPDAFLKWYQGWITPTNTFDGRSYVLGSAATRANALLIGEDLNGVEWQLYSNPPVIGTSEYWLVENRQLTGYDAALPGCGILIWHVYEGSPTTNEANADSTLPLVALEQADGLGHLEQSILPPDVYPSVNLQLGDPQDTYGLETRLDWGPATTPNSNFYVGGFNNGNSSMRALSVNPIADCSSDSFMTVVYDGPEPAPPMLEGLFLPLVQK